MKVEIRKTLTGTEYWDSKEKRTVFVPKGKNHKFDITEETKEVISKKEYLGEFVGPDLNDMNTEQLITFAEDNGVNVPGNMKKEDTIRNYIIEELNAASDSE